MFAGERRARRPYTRDMLYLPRSPRRCSASPIVALAVVSFTFACAANNPDNASTTDGATDGESVGASAPDSDGEDASTGDAVDDDAPTWHQDIAPIVAGRCAGCHKQAGIAPFSLTDYEQSAQWASLMAAAVEEGSMPPFAADETEDCSMRFGWKDDLRVSAAEEAVLRAWAEAGAPEGDPATAAPLPGEISVELTDADVRLTPKSSVSVEGTSDKFYCFVLDPQLDEDAYLAATQIVPGNDKIVHHVLVYTDEDGSSEADAGAKGWYECAGGGISGDSLIAAWAPGAVPNRTPENTAFKLTAGSRLIVNIHYHPTGAGVEVDPGTALDLKWFDGLPDNIAELALVGNEDGDELLPGPNDEGGKQFRIPAGVDDHTETMEVTIDDDYPALQIWSIAAHMHYVGVDMHLGIRRGAPNILQPEEECLLQTPSYSFEWQRFYVYDAPLDRVPTAQGGDTLTLRCTYNNSASNPYVVEALDELGLDAPVDVYLGEETLDEMCLGAYGILYPRALADQIP